MRDNKCQITMSSTYESNYYEDNTCKLLWVWVKLLWVVHMSQIEMSSTYVNYYE